MRRLLALHLLERHIGEQVELLDDFPALSRLIRRVLCQIDGADPLVLFEDLVWLLKQQGFALLLQQVS